MYFQRSFIENGKKNSYTSHLKKTTEISRAHDEKIVLVNLETYMTYSRKLWQRRAAHKLSNELVLMVAKKGITGDSKNAYFLRATKVWNLCRVMIHYGGKDKNHRIIIPNIETRQIYLCSMIILNIYSLIYFLGNRQKFNLNLVRLRI